ncbi:MAG: polysaccharide deacetylase family protein, partial [Dermatophilaceae bacterium]
MTRRSRMRGPLAVGVLAVSLVVGGCGSAQTPEPGQTTPSPVSTSTSRTSTMMSSPSTATTTTAATTTAAPPGTTRTTPPRTTTTTTTPRTTTTTTTPPKTTTTTASCSLSGYAGMDVERLATTKKVVALTFDGGGSDAGGRKILDTLSAKGVPATFFFTGRFTE